MERKKDYMKNAKMEFLNEIKEREVKCAWIIKDKFEMEGDKKEMILKVGWTDEDMKEFIKEMDFDYDSGYGMQLIEGFIW